MRRLLVFDLDGTLAQLGKAISDCGIARLRRTEELGYTIAVCSGKPVSFLCGLTFI